MKITDSCVELFRKVMEQHNATAIRLFTTETDCGHGRSVNIEVTNDDSLRLILVNNLYVAVTEEDEELLSDIVFDADGDKVYVSQECDCCDGDCHDENCSCEGCKH